MKKSGALCRHVGVKVNTHQNVKIKATISQTRWQRKSSDMMRLAPMAGRPWFFAAERLIDRDPGDGNGLSITVFCPSFSGGSEMIGIVALLSVFFAVMESDVGGRSVKGLTPLPVADSNMEWGRLADPVRRCCI
jgi:hypothetical protein